jgi:hypothetical protein
MDRIEDGSDLDQSAPDAAGVFQRPRSIVVEFPPSNGSLYHMDRLQVGSTHGRALPIRSTHSPEERGKLDAAQGKQTELILQITSKGQIHC